MKNKKGVDMTISSIVIIILALVVLVVLILGFTAGWGEFWKKVNIFGGTGNDVQTTLEACQVSCAKQSTYDFCTKIRTIKVDGNPILENTCTKLYDKYGGSCDITCTGTTPTVASEVIPTP